MTFTPIASLFIRKTYVYIGISFLSLINLHVYNQSIAPANAYLGYLPIEISGTELAVFFVGGMLMAFFYPMTIRRPSDFFGVVYLLFVFYPYLVFHSVLGQISLGEVATRLSLGLVPLVVVYWPARVLPIAFPKAAIVNRPFVFYSLGLICIVGLGLALQRVPGNAMLDFVGAYERRMQARALFPSRSLVSYLTAMSMNGFAPFLAFLAAYQKKPLWLILAFFSAIGFFYVMGVKNPTALTCVAASFGFVCRKKAIGKIPLGVVVLLILVSIGAMLEWHSTGYSYIADYLLRRIYAAVAFLQNFYFDLILNHLGSWSFWHGVEYNGGVTYYIGEILMGVPDTNANTNTWLYATGQVGVRGLIGTWVVVLGVFLLLDSVYRRHRDPAVLYVALLFSLLLVEQAATTALWSSGVGVLILLVLVLRGDDVARVRGHGA